MKILLDIITTFLLVEFVSCGLMYYIYDDTPNMGYVTAENRASALSKGGLSGLQRKHFTGPIHSKYQKNSEHIVDSHFKVLKSAPNTAKILINAKHTGIQESQSNTVSSKQWQKINGRPDATIQQDSMVNNALFKISHGVSSKSQDMNASPITKQQKSRQPVPIYIAQLKQRNQYQENNDKSDDSKPSMVKVNVHKTQISTIPQKIVKLNNNRQMSALSVYGPEGNFQIMPVSMMADSNLQKTPGYNERNSQIMSRLLDDMTQNLSDRRTYSRGDYKKRDIDEINTGPYEKFKRNALSDNMRKYIGKDKSLAKDRRHNIEPARIKSEEESMEVNDSPYALFYKMHPETVDSQNAFMIGADVDTSKNVNTNKDKRLSLNFEDEVNMNRNRSKKNTNTVKLHKKVKNFANFRNI